MVWGSWSRGGTGESGLNGRGLRVCVRRPASPIPPRVHVVLQNVRSGACLWGTAPRGARHCRVGGRVIQLGRAFENAHSDLLSQKRPGYKHGSNLLLGVFCRVYLSFCPDTSFTELLGKSKLTTPRKLHQKQLRTAPKITRCNPSSVYLPVFISAAKIYRAGLRPLCLFVKTRLWKTHYAKAYFIDKHNRYREYTYLHEYVYSFAFLTTVITTWPRSDLFSTGELKYFKRFVRERTLWGQLRKATRHEPLPHNVLGFLPQIPLPLG